MADALRKKLVAIQQIPGNDTCADCCMPDPEWVSVNLGIFVCSHCAGIHRELGVDISRIKSITLDNWMETEEIEFIEKTGNLCSNQKFERFLPPYYRKPTKNDKHECQQILREHWIKSKYGNKFTVPEGYQAYSHPTKIGMLWKQGKNDKKFQQRKFRLSQADNRLYYFQKENKKAKADINLDDLNAVFVPHKLGKKTGMQLSYLKDGSTRSIYVYSDIVVDIVDWYQEIRAAKLERRKIAFPDRDEKELSEELTRDFILEGWLSKMGPSQEPFRKRWFTLDKRKLMYFLDKLSAHPKGEIFIGHKDNGFSVSPGAADARQTNGYTFTLVCPDNERDFIFSAETKEEMEQWICALKNATEIPLTPQDAKLANILVPKRRDSFNLMNKFK